MQRQPRSSLTINQDHDQSPDLNPIVIWSRNKFKLTWRHFSTTCELVEGTMLSYCIYSIDKLIVLYVLYLCNSCFISRQGIFFLSK